MRLVIFDADGTLVDSQAIIHEAMCATFDEFGYQSPHLESTRSIIGLTLNLAIAKLLDRAVNNQIEQMSASYKLHYQRLMRIPEMESKLYDGIIEVIENLHQNPDTLLAIATGKSRRGLDILIDTYDLNDKLIASRSADDCPSKPHPAMIMECCELAGCDPAQSVMVGDSSYDMAMARNAGAHALGVSWGYQSNAELMASGAHKIIDNPREIVAAVNGFLGGEVS